MYLIQFFLNSVIYDYKLGRLLLRLFSPLTVIELELCGPIYEKINRDCGTKITISSACFVNCFSVSRWGQLGNIWSGTESMTHWLTDILLYWIIDSLTYQTTEALTYLCINHLLYSIEIVPYIMIIQCVCPLSPF